MSAFDLKLCASPSISLYNYLIIYLSYNFSVIGLHLRNWQTIYLFYILCAYFHTYLNWAWRYKSPKKIWKINSRLSYNIGRPLILKVSLSWVYCRCIWKDLAAAKWYNWFLIGGAQKKFWKLASSIKLVFAHYPIKVNPNQVWPGFYSCECSIADFRRTKGWIDLKFSVLVNKQAQKISDRSDFLFFWNHQLKIRSCRPRPGSHLIGIDFRIIPLCRRQIFPNTAAMNSAQRNP